MAKRRRNVNFWGLISIPIVIIIACVIIGFAVTERRASPYNSSVPFIPTNRLANNKDFLVDGTEVISFSPKLILTPKYNIDDLIIKICYYDKNHTLIYTTQKTLGDIKKGIEYYIELTLKDLPLLQLGKIEEQSIEVVHGLVFRFQSKLEIK